MQLESCQRPARKLQHCSNRDAREFVIVSVCFLRHTATRAIRLHSAKQAGERCRDAPESEADSTELPRDWNQGTLAAGGRTRTLDQAAVGYALV